MYLPPDTNIMRRIKDEGVRVVDHGHGYIAYAINFY